MRIAAVGRLKHDELWRAAQEVGGQLALARHLHVPPSQLNAWINLQSLPPVTAEDVARRPTWDADRHREFERKLFKLTGKSLIELFPEAMRQCTAFFKADKKFAQTREIDDAALLSYAETQRERLQLLGPHENVEQGEIKELIARVIVTLPERERRILTLLYGLDGQGERSYHEVADQENCTHQTIRNIENRALGHLRKPHRLEPLLSYAE